MLPKRHRLRTGDFKELRGARAIHSPHFLARMRPLPADKPAKAAAVVSLSVCRTAVARNRLRRRIYDALRGFTSGRTGFLLTVTAKSGAAAWAHDAMRAEVQTLVERVLSL